MVLPVLSAILVLPFLVLAHPTPNSDGLEVVKRSLPSRWYQERGHPVEKLFMRQTEPTDGVNYPAIGSPQWSQGYPPVPPDPTKMPQEWTNALNAAVNAGKIPNIPPSTSTSSQNPTPVYQGVNPGDPSVCSASYGCRAPGDIWDAPNGTIGISFDDGPSLGSDLLYTFLEGNKIPSTHFMIGANILNNPTLFSRAFQELHSDIAVHTWSHRYMTTLSNAEVVAEFGWTMEIIKNSTGGRLPRYWRPPYGDTDNRVRAIASEVFGLQTIIWNHDTLDWSLTTQGGTTSQAISASMTQWLNGPKSPGLLILEHELTDNSAQAFIDAYPLIVTTGWNIMSAAQMEGQTVYLNSKDGLSPVQPFNGVLGAQYSNTPTTSSSPVVPSSTAPPPAPSNTTANSNTSQSDKNKNGSTQSFVSKLAGVLGGMILTVAFYA